MLSESHPYIRRIIRFCLLPYCYFKLIPWDECTKSRLEVAKDLLYIFFKYKYYPDNYGPCRFWETDNREWSYYYGSSYEPYQRKRLRRFVQRYDYQILFNDKEFWEQFCQGLQLSMPRYFGVLEPDSNYKGHIENYFADPSTKKLILKPIQGHAGSGIMLAEFTSQGIEIKTAERIYSLKDFKLPDKCVVQEVIEQHPDVAEFSSSSVNTIRIVTLWTKNNDIILVSGSMRFGQGDSFVDNWSAGGVSVGIDTDAGTLKKYAYDKHGNRYVEHPVSGKKFEGFQIPEWHQAVAMARRIQEVSPFYRLVGCDIAMTESGPVLIEANADPDIVYQEQVSGPILADKRVFDEFKKYDLLINKYQRSVYD
jgi:glutathione synthase/RimK-type ligase-like ATP-grasp enzyme